MTARTFAARICTLEARLRKKHGPIAACSTLTETRRGERWLGPVGRLRKNDSCWKWWRLDK